MVNARDEASVTIVYGESTVAFRIRVADHDRGKIIGKDGRNINALRILLNALKGKGTARCIIELADDYPKENSFAKGA